MPNIVSDFFEAEDTIDLIAILAIVGIVAFIGYEVYEFLTSGNDTFNPQSPTSVYGQAVAPGTIIDSVANANDCIAANGFWESAKSLFTTGGFGCGS